MKTDKQFLLFIFSSYMVLIIGILFFYFFKPFANKCISGSCSNGFGVYLYSSGMKYEGEWKNGRREGKGTLTYPDGSKYEGEWKNDRMDGFGVKTYVDNSLYKYTGEWKNGNKQGKGTQIFKKIYPVVEIGEQFTGDWEKGKIKGHGILTYRNGGKLEGEWKDLVQQGTMTETYPDGRVLVVEWKDQRRNGRGILTYPDGTTVIQEWINNKLVGSVDFYLFYYYEFKKDKDIDELCSAVKSDINLSLKAQENTLEWLNELLKEPNLYEEFNKKQQHMELSPKLKALIERTKAFRTKKFSELNEDEQRDTIKANRLLLEQIYPHITPKS